MTTRFDHPERLPDEVLVGYYDAASLHFQRNMGPFRIGVRHIGDDERDVPRSSLRPVFVAHDAYVLRLLDGIADLEARMTPVVAEQACAPLRAQLAELREWRKPTFAQAAEASGIAGPFYTVDEALAELGWDAPRGGDNAPTAIRCCGASVGIYVARGEIGVLGCEICGKRAVNLVGPHPGEEPVDVREPADGRTWGVDRA